LPDLRDPMCSATYKLLTPATPPVVWSALTCPQRTSQYLYGLSLSSGWHPGDTVEVRAPGVPDMAGRVLCVQPQQHLAYAIEDDSGSTTFLEWTVRPALRGSVVALAVHESGAPGDEDDSDEVWLTVVERLRAVLIAR